MALIMALISFFTAKKSGMKDGAAAMTAAAAGLGTYYVATETEWGKSATNWLGEKWTALTDDGTVLKNADGTDATAPPGAVPQKDANGNVIRDANGSVTWKLVDTAGKVVTTTGDVLKSWGATGTATVIGTTALATDDNLRKWLPWLGAGLLALVILK